MRFKLSPFEVTVYSLSAFGDGIRISLKMK